MDCASCAALIEMDLEDGGIKATCSYRKETLDVTGAHVPKKIFVIVKKGGYSIN